MPPPRNAPDPAGAPAASSYSATPPATAYASPPVSGTASAASPVSGAYPKPTGAYPPPPRAASRDTSPPVYDALASAAAEVSNEDEHLQHGEEPTWASTSLGMRRDQGKYRGGTYSATPEGMGASMDDPEPTWAASSLGIQPSVTQREQTLRRDPTDPRIGAKFRRRRTRNGVASRIPALVAAAVVCLLLVVGGIWWFSGGEDSQEASQGAYLPNLTVTAVTIEAEEAGLECQTPGNTSQRCEREITGALLSITLTFDGETQVRSVQADGGTGMYTTEDPSQEDLDAFFRMAAGIPLQEHLDQIEAAQTWVLENLGTTAEAEFAGVRYQTEEGLPRLTMTAAGGE